jgi:ribonuclease PH
MTALRQELACGCRDVLWLTVTVPVAYIAMRCNGMADSSRQATAEKVSITRAHLNGLIDLAEAGLKKIFAAQRAVLGC